MKHSVKLLIGLAIALAAIGVVCVVALRYMDILLRPVNAVRNVLRNFRRDDECDFDCDDCEEQAF